MNDANHKAPALPPIVSLRDREHLLALEFVRAAKNFSGRKSAKNG